MLSAKIRNSFLSILALGTIGVVSVLYYSILVYAALPISMHDTAHYATAGVSMARDHKNLIYPYGSLKAFQYGATYEAFQTNSHAFDTRTSYPNQLFSWIFGLFYLATGSVKVWYLHIVSCASLVLGNCFLYLTGRSFLSRSDSILSLFLMNTSALFAFVFPQASNDAMSYLCFAIAFWLSLKSSKIWIVAAFLGASILIRSQSSTLLLVMPIFLMSEFSWKAYRKRLFLMVTIAFAVVYGYGKVSGLILERAEGGSSVAFYFSYFKESIYGIADFHRIILDFIKDIARLPDGNALYLFICVSSVVNFIKSEIKRVFGVQNVSGRFHHYSFAGLFLRI